MRDINSLRQNSQFKKAYQRGKYKATPEVVLYARKVSGAGGFGITASKKIGNAVSRNRAKRRLRALYRKFRTRLRIGYDIVAVARTRTVNAPYSKLEESFLKAIRDVGVLKEENEE